MNVNVLTAALAMALAIAACNSNSSEPAVPSPTGPQLDLLNTVTLGSGPAWDPQLPPEQQDLADHFAYVGGLFETGALIAYGPRSDGLGLYLYLAEQAPAVEQLLLDDPAVQDGVLSLAEQGRWQLAFDALDSEVDALSAFLLNYEPGPAWVAEKPLAEQAIGPHLDHVSGLFGQGALIAGGPVSDVMGRYVVVAADEEGARAMVEADPGVQSGVFEVSIMGWTPLQRQSAAQARSRAR